VRQVHSERGYMPKVVLVMDPSHASWVIGGIFNDVSQFNTRLFSSTILITNVRNKLSLTSLLGLYTKISSTDILFFSSYTVLQNFKKYKPFAKNKKIIWFTHLSTKPSQKFIEMLNETNQIFCHSEYDKNELSVLGVNTPICSIVGVVDPSRFFSKPIRGNKVVWIGTSVSRKNPESFLEFAQQNPKINFKILGKNWKEDTRLFNILSKLSNIEYSEIDGPLKSEDFDNCSHYLMTSSIEGGPISLIEAVSAGMIPVCTKTGIAEEFLARLDYRNQLIKFPLDFEEIKAKLSSIYSYSHIEEASIVAKSFSVKRLNDIFENVISEIYD
jgi:glycosyltransferase involved in cell wall biosynthesis